MKNKIFSFKKKTPQNNCTETEIRSVEKKSVEFISPIIPIFFTIFPCYNSNFPNQFFQNIRSTRNIKPSQNPTMIHRSNLNSMIFKHQIISIK